ncbi:uncharacterized protein LOC132038532 [Lycium ferocissimum]|uniref:uncharacterized protein LOC132038532 n=1 Tax=Lycium ferocissimum TaxID=112874 RepID=UPI0028150087|nr:uncharacterized protein LOC132038532 [Lycium ferocissimum]
MGTPALPETARLVENQVQPTTPNNENPTIKEKNNCAKAIQSIPPLLTEKKRHGNPDVKAWYTNHDEKKAILFKTRDFHGVMVEECRLTFVGKFIKTRPQPQIEGSEQNSQRKSRLECRRVDQKKGEDKKANMNKDKPADQSGSSGMENREDDSEEEKHRKEKPCQRIWQGKKERLMRKALRRLKKMRDWRRNKLIHKIQRRKKMDGEVQETIIHDNQRSQNQDEHTAKEKQNEQDMTNQEYNSDQVSKDKEKENGKCEVAKNSDSIPMEIKSMKAIDLYMELNCEQEDQNIQNQEKAQEEEDQHGKEESMEFRTQSNNSVQNQNSDENTSRRNRSRSRHRDKKKNQKEGKEEHEEEKKEVEESKETNTGGRNKNKKGDKQDNDKASATIKRRNNRQQSPSLSFQ